MFLQFLLLDLASVQIGFDAVLIGFLRSTCAPFATDKFTIQQASRDAIFLHAENMPHPSESCLDEDGFDADGFSTVQDFKVGDMILPMYSKCRPKSTHVT